MREGFPTMFENCLDINVWIENFERIEGRWPEIINDVLV
jgi:hypothetical protein